MNTPSSPVIHDPGASRGSTLLGLGVFLLVFGFIAFCAAVAGNASAGPGFLTLDMMILGICFIVAGKRLRRRPDRLRRYMAVLSNGNRLRVQDLSRLCRQPVNRVRRDMQYMMDKGLVLNLVYDAGTQSFFLRSDAGYAPQTAPVNQAVPNAAIEPVRRRVRCGGCGAVGEVVDGIGVCEYCGSPLDPNREA